MLHGYSMHSVAFKSMKRKSFKFAGMTIHEANMSLIFQLYDLYDDREAANIADLVMENVTGWKRIVRVTNKKVKMSGGMINQLEKYTQELLTHKPVQYVLGEAWFMGMRFYVNEHVLIPRPETEELVDRVIKEIKRDNATALRILDIGTGSGCISIAIKKYVSEAEVYSVDVSEKAIQVARKNSELNNVDVKFILSDILDESMWNDLPPIDIIVSNPPYIPSNEKNLMEDNVTKFEPHIALFVPDSDPLTFYKAIARFAEKELLPGGKVYLETHANYSEKVKDVFSDLGDTRIKNDMQNKPRFVITERRIYQP